MEISNIFNCPKCLKIFSNQYTLKRHILNKPPSCLEKEVKVNNKTLDKLECPHCNKKLSTKPSYYRHINHYCDLVPMKEKKRKDNKTKRINDSKATNIQAIPNPPSSNSPVTNAPSTNSLAIINPIPNNGSPNQSTIPVTNLLNQPTTQIKTQLTTFGNTQSSNKILGIHIKGIVINEEELKLLDPKNLVILIESELNFQKCNYQQEKKYISLLIMINADNYLN